MPSAYFGFAAKLEGRDNIMGWMRRFGHPPLPSYVEHTLNNGGTNSSYISRLGLERDELHCIWAEVHAVSGYNAPPFVLVSHRYYSERCAPGGNKDYDVDSVLEYHGTFKELATNTHEAMLSAFQELRGWPVTE